jgi:hypothetical protein
VASTSIVLAWPGIAWMTQSRVGVEIELTDMQPPSTGAPTGDVNVISPAPIEAVIFDRAPLGDVFEPEQPATEINAIISIETVLTLTGPS